MEARTSIDEILRRKLSLKRVYKLQRTINAARYAQQEFFTADNSFATSSHDQISLKKVCEDRNNAAAARKIHAQSAKELMSHIPESILPQGEKIALASMLSKNTAVEIKIPVEGYIPEEQDQLKQLIKEIIDNFYLSLFALYKKQYNDFLKLHIQYLEALNKYCMIQSSLKDGTETSNLARIMNDTSNFLMEDLYTKPDAGKGSLFIKTLAEAKNNYSANQLVQLINLLNNKIPDDSAYFVIIIQSIKTMFDSISQKNICDQGEETLGTQNNTTVLMNFDNNSQHSIEAINTLNNTNLTENIYKEDLTLHSPNRSASYSSSISNISQASTVFEVESNISDESFHISTPFSEGEHYSDPLSGSNHCLTDQLGLYTLGQTSLDSKTPQSFYDFVIYQIKSFLKTLNTLSIDLIQKIENKEQLFYEFLENSFCYREQLNQLATFHEYGYFNVSDAFIDKQIMHNGKVNKKEISEIRKLFKKLGKHLDNAERTQLGNTTEATPLEKDFLRLHKLKIEIEDKENSNKGFGFFRYKTSDAVARMRAKLAKLPAEFHSKDGRQIGQIAREMFNIMEEKQQVTSCFPSLKQIKAKFFRAKEMTGKYSQWMTTLGTFAINQKTHSNFTNTANLNEPGTLVRNNSNSSATSQTACVN